MPLYMWHIASASEVIKCDEYWAEIRNNVIPSAARDLATALQALLSELKAKWYLVVCAMFIIGAANALHTA